MASDGAGCGSSERGRSGSEAPVGPGSDRDAALSGDLVVSAGSHDRGCRGGDELRPALDRAVIPTRVKADSFWGFQNRASQTLWWRTGGSPCGQGLHFVRTMMQPSFGP